MHFRGSEWGVTFGVVVVVVVEGEPRSGKRRQTPKQRAFVPSLRPLYDARLHALTACLRRLRCLKFVSMGLHEPWRCYVLEVLIGPSRPSGDLPGRCRSCSAFQALFRRS
jgi:hypothetical protein